MKKPLNPNAQKWVAALRSGEYKQGEGWLLADGKYCCLGVACDLFQKEIGTLAVESKVGMTTFDDEGARLPEAVQHWLGLSDPWGYFDSQNHSLYASNDEGTAFSEIADLIESQPEGLFA